MLEDLAAVGVAAVILAAWLLWFGLSRALRLPQQLFDRAADKLQSRTMVFLLIGLMVALLFFSLVTSGAFTSLSTESQGERNRDYNRMVITQDKDGCLDMRTLGRSNGVYMSVKPCKPANKKDPSSK